MDGVEPPLALIGVGEKGYADIRIKVSGDGGHSSMPPKHTSLGLLAQAICLLEEKKHKIRPDRAGQGIPFDRGAGDGAF